jgi:hypothetical protein
MESFHLEKPMDINEIVQFRILVEESTRLVQVNIDT